jgi:hypothetical protein
VPGLWIPSLWSGPAGPRAYLRRTRAAAGGGPLRADTFDRADSSGGLGTPSDGGSVWVQDTSGGGVTFGISSNKAYDPFDNNGHLVASLEASAADVSVQVTLAAFAGQMGLSARVSDANNFLNVRALAGTGYSLFKRVAGSSTQLGSTWAGTPADGDVVKLVMSGSSLEVFVNGVSRITATDSFNSTATKHGLWAFAANFTAARWDDFSIT